MVNKDLFIHSKDDMFFESLKENLVFKKEMEDYYINFIEKKSIPDLLGKTVKITDKQFSKVYRFIKDICAELEIKNVDAYVYEDFYYGVESKGISKPWLEISAKTIEDFSNEELKFLIGKEIYNIKFKNTYYSLLMTRCIENFKMIKLPGSDITEEGFKFALYKWHRVMNFSSDNFGFTASGSLKASINSVLLTILNNKTLVKNLNINEYIKQASEIGNLDDEIYNNTKLDELMPYGPYRVKNLIAYASSMRAKQAKVQMNF